MDEARAGGLRDVHVRQAGLRHDQGGQELRLVLRRRGRHPTPRGDPRAAGRWRVPPCRSRVQRRRGASSKTSHLERLTGEETVECPGFKLSPQSDQIRVQGWPAADLLGRAASRRDGARGRRARTGTPRTPRRGAPAPGVGPGRAASRTRREGFGSPPRRRGALRPAGARPPGSKLPLLARSVPSHTAPSND
jgi:hypothetical protein